MAKTSIIIPARVEKHLQRTIDDIFQNATGDIEIIVVLDGWWPDPILKDDPRLILLHWGEPRGMRESVNGAARIAKGRYLLKCDAHCSFGKGFDEILRKDCGDNWICVPSKYSLDADKWERFRGPVDYLYLTFPYVEDDQFGYGLHGKKWKGKTGLTGSWWDIEKERKDTPIDDIMVFQGSCWFMRHRHFLNIGGEDSKQFIWGQEAPELSFKTWLSGGRVVVNKNTWFAHWHKDDRGFKASNRDKRNTMIRSCHYWMNNRWSGQKMQFKDYINKFRPLEGWPEDWEVQQMEWELKNPLDEGVY
jgi:glycosyltransferase involved in cell wall biosynthesis